MVSPIRLHITTKSEIQVTHLKIYDLRILYPYQNNLESQIEPLFCYYLGKRYLKNKKIVIPITSDCETLNKVVNVNTVAGILFKMIENAISSSVLLAL